jgi:hypothetical protein
MRGNARISAGMSNHLPPPAASGTAVVPLVERLKRVAQLWADANGRSLGALATIVANHGSFFERLAAPDAGTTTATLEKFARFLTEAANWPEGMVPQEVCLFAHAVGVSGGACPASPDIAADLIGAVGVARTNVQPAASMPPGEEPVPEPIGAALPIGTSGRPAAHIAAGPAVPDAAPGFPPKAVAGAAGDPALPAGSAA